MTTTKRLAIYGKGGSGKSMVASNLSLQFARRGLKSLQIGCDPKHDSTRSLTAGHRITTVVDVLQQGLDKRPQGTSADRFLVHGLAGIGCIETGGPESGAGCAGLGIVAAFRLFDKLDLLNDFDVVLMDVLGDVVCGGFAMPLTRGLASGVAIVVSDTMMSMYAANNIAKAVVRYQRNGSALLGLIANNLLHPERLAEIEDFAARLGTRVLVSLPHDDGVLEAERRGQPVSANDAGGPLDDAFAGLANELLAMNPAECATPSPMTEEQWDDFIRQLGD